MWPVHLAPFQVVVICTNMDVDLAREVAEGIYDGLAAAGIEAVLDDRDERAGVKFADADLIGYPVQVIVGKKGLGQQQVELKVRATGERSSAPLDGAVAAVQELIGGMRDRR